MDFFHRPAEDVFQSIVCAMPWCATLHITVFPIVVVLWGSEMQALLATRAR